MNATPDDTGGVELDPDRVTNIEPATNSRPGRRTTKKSIEHSLAAAASIIRGQARRPGLDHPHLGAVAKLSEVIEATLAAMVTRLRAEGASWAVIGRELGMSRQAAQQRFGGAEGDAKGDITDVMGTPELTPRSAASDAWRPCAACGSVPAVMGDRYCAACASAPDRSAWAQ